MTRQTVRDTSGMQRWGTTRRTVISGDDNNNDNDDNDSSAYPDIEIIGDTADSDAENNVSGTFTMDHVTPNELEGDLEDIIMTDMPRSYGVQSFQEDTYYPQSNRTVSRFYNKPR